MSIIDFLKENLIKIIKNRKAVFTLILGIILSLICLLTTFSLILSLIIFLISISIIIFNESFSRGWLFLFFIALLFPTTAITPDFLLLQLILSVIIILSFLQLIYENSRFELGRISYYFFLIILISISIKILGPIFNAQVSPQTNSILVSFTFIWLLLLIFQYFFHTRKRIKRFILLIITIGCIHSLFGLLAIIFSWHNAQGIGAVYLTSNQGFLFNLPKLTGLWGTQLNDGIGPNSMASFLSITILLTLGYFLILARNKSNLGTRTKTRIGVIVAILMLQTGGLLMTQSTFSLIIVGISAIMLGIILKNKKIIWWASGWTLFFSIMISKYSSPQNFNTEWINNFKTPLNWLIGNGIIFDQGALSLSGNIHNSFIYLVNSIGIFGFLILLILFYYFFMAIYNNFRIVSGENRIIMATVATIFVCTILEAFDGNVILFGPTAIVFWLFYGIVINFRRDALDNQFLNEKIFYRIFRKSKRMKPVDSVRRPML